MSIRALRPATFAWAILILLTFTGFFAIEYSLRSTLGVAIVMPLSAVKVRIVLYRFMELAETPLGLRLFFNIWLILCATLIFLFYWLAS